MAKSVKEFWGAGSRREKLIEFYRVIKGRGVDESKRSLANKADVTKAGDLAKSLIKDYSTSSGQLKSMLESAEWTPENIEDVLSTK
tara:strand:+ start:398 stop:655 length:258 start_codon:yes stop_codon:yes gene_type:complete